MSWGFSLITVNHMQRLLIFCHSYPFLIIQRNFTSSSAILCSILKSPWEDIIKGKVWWIMAGISDRNTMQKMYEAEPTAHLRILLGSSLHYNSLLWEKRQADGLPANILSSLLQVGWRQSSTWALTNCSAKYWYKYFFLGMLLGCKKTSTLNFTNSKKFRWSNVLT